MNSPARPALVWVAWLKAVSIGVSIFGLALVIAPRTAREGFSLLIYSDKDQLSSFGPHVVGYISLAHAVLGSVMFGWGLALVMIVHHLLASGSRVGWQIVAVSVMGWCIPDTVFSLWLGFWHNAVLNLVIVVLYSVPLLATRRSCLR